MFCLRSSQIWSKAFWTDIYWNLVCVNFYQLWAPSKYNWRSSSGEQWRPIYWEWQRAGLTGKTGLFVGEHHHKSEHPEHKYSTLTKAATDKRFVNFLFIGNLANREISRGIYQNHGVCGQAFPLLYSPSPFHFFCSRSNFCTITR